MNLPFFFCIGLLWFWVAWKKQKNYVNCKLCLQIGRKCVGQNDSATVTFGKKRCSFLSSALEVLYWSSFSPLSHLIWPLGCLNRLANLHWQRNGCQTNFDFD